MKSRSIIARWVAGLSCAASLCMLSPYASASSLRAAKQVTAVVDKQADFRGQPAPRDVQHIADWAVHSGDHQALPFMVLDKVHAKLYAFDYRGKLVRATPVLLGMGVGDAFPPGVAEMDMYQTEPWQRVTPAGRFRADLEATGRGKSLLWIDYDTGIALHKVPARKTRQRRHDRIRSPDAADKRITYGCINVPSAFYDEVVQPAYRARGGIVYVLPETTPAAALFGAYEVPRRTADSSPAALPPAIATARAAPRSSARP